MQSVLSRSQMNNSTVGTSYRVPRRSSSFLSLKREKSKSHPQPEPLSTSQGRSHQQSYFEAYPRPKSSHGAQSSRYAKPLNDSSLLPLENASEGGGGGSSRRDQIVFPTSDLSEDLYAPSTPKQSTRTRSRTGPSKKSKWEEPSLPHLRFSGSSSTQHTETPPRTPVDSDASLDPFDSFPVVVAAPVAGVETMDALVDGMNGGEDLLSRAAALSSRHRFAIPGHHPLYQPPLPTPPPGVVLGGGKARRAKSKPPPDNSSDSGNEDSAHSTKSPTRVRRRRTRPSSSRNPSSSTISAPRSVSNPEHTEGSSDRPSTSNSPTSERRKSVVPSISEIIRNHVPTESMTKSRPTTPRSSIFAGSTGHSIAHEQPAYDPVLAEDDGEMISRSSIDSIADEVQRTLRNQMMARSPQSVPPSSFNHRQSTISDNTSIYSPRSDPGGAASTYASSMTSTYYPSPPFEVSSSLSLAKPSTPTQEVAQYLRSARLTSLLRLTRSPHASQDNPLTVSLSDLGSPAGFPVVVFLGLGCVRHIMGLYDEMADCLGLRLITIDRWGLGKTDARPKSVKGIMQWASVVEEVLDILGIEECSVMAHSAGAPYALSFANKVPLRVRGEICLLAPWVGGSESNGYKWLKYVPNGILKTAQAAEWKMQAWMLGKPPTVTYEGIGYTVQPSAKSQSDQHDLSVRPDVTSDSLSAPSESHPRPSIGSSTFSEYDDLRDFDGRFESRSTLGVGSNGQPVEHTGDDRVLRTKRKPSRGFLDMLKGSHPSPQSPPLEKAAGGKKLKALRSMGSLKGRSQSMKRHELASPPIPLPVQTDIGLGLNEFDWDQHGAEQHSRCVPSSNQGSYRRSAGVRSISFTSAKASLSLPPSPSPSSAAKASINGGVGSKNSYQAVLGNALIAASHREASKGAHDDLLQILNHGNHPWGFSYSSYPHRVRVWYGDKDEKIAENAVRWMERTMTEERCHIKVVKGADHGLMYNSGVVVEVLESILSYWKSKERRPF